MLFFLIIIVSVFLIILITDASSSGYGFAKRTFKITFTYHKLSLQACNGVDTITIYSKRFDSLLTISLLIVCAISLLTILYINDFFTLFLMSPLRSFIYILPVFVIICFILKYMAIYTSKVILYYDKILVKNLFKKKILYLNTLGQIQLINYNKLYPDRFGGGRRSQSRHAYHIISNGKVIKKLWGHHFSNLDRLEDAYTSENCYVKEIIKSNVADEKAVQFSGFFNFIIQKFY